MRDSEVGYDQILMLTNLDVDMLFRHAHSPVDRIKASEGTQPKC